MQQISRYYFSKKDLRLDNTFKHNIFEPPKSIPELSVYITDNLTNSEIWNIGDQHVAPLRGKPILGAAQIRSCDVVDIGLSILQDGVPHHLHANIIGWKGNTEDRVIALKLAAKASALIR
jgi:hypothetical protein